MFLALVVSQVTGRTLDGKLNMGIDRHIQRFVSSASKGSRHYVGHFPSVDLVVRDIIPQRNHAVCIANESGALLPHSPVRNAGRPALDCLPMEDCGKLIAL